jgi:type II secretory pathway pseudopilin PulG
MIEMLGVMVVVLVLVGMAAVSAVRTKAIEADAQARFYAALLQTHMAEYGRRNKDNIAWTNTRAAYNALPAADRQPRAIIALVGSAFPGDPLLTQNGPMVKALDGYTVEFRSTPMEPLIVKRNGVTIYPLE